MLLKSGDKGIQVKYLQQGLRMMCCNPGAIDSQFGPGTVAAVQKFQDEWGLDADGIVGDQTWDCLCGEIEPLQQALKEKGFYTGAITGIAKDTTYNAVLKFQKSEGLTSDGMVGAATRARLFSANEGGGDESVLPLKKGDRGDYVLSLQYGLRIMCCTPGALDGVYGSGTEEAVKRYQGKYGLEETGIVESDTWNQLSGQIYDIQERLLERGYEVALVNGRASSALVENIKQFQEANWLRPDGQVGPSTYEILFSDVEDGATDALPLKRGSRGPRVLQFQYALRVSCINPNGTDGVFGAGTESAVNRFKTNNNLSADGCVDVQTWEIMCDHMRPIHTALANRGYDVGYVDGIITEQVYNGVLQFQKDNDLTADGMVGSATKLLLLGGTDGKGTVSSTLKIGSNGSLTRYLQRLFHELGYSVTINGIFDEETRAAAIAYQTDRGLDADGIVGGGTWAKLFEDYRLTLSGTSAEKLVQAAKHELEWGFSEDNFNNITPYGQWYGMNGSAWCAMFVSYCAYQAGILDEVVPKYAWCPSGMNWYRERGRYHKKNSGYIPKKGDVIFFYNEEKGRVSHTGIVVGGDEKNVRSIEGNTTIDAVDERTYSRTQEIIDGYGDNGGERIEIMIPPTEEEIENALLAYYRELLDELNVSYVNEELALNQEWEVVSSPNSKFLIEARADMTLYEESAGKPLAVTFDVKDGVAFRQELNLTDHLAIVLEEMNMFDPQEVIDLYATINMTIDTGISVFECGLRTDEDGEWVYVKYTVTTKVPIKTGYPAEDFSFSYTLCIRNEYMPLLEQIVVYAEEHPEITVPLVSALVCIVIVFYTGDLVAAGEMLKEILKTFFTVIKELEPAV